MTASDTRTSNTGFTLLEVAIVLLIIGLLVSGVVIGRSIVRNAELREVIGEYDRYLKAVKEFQDKYNQLPGDFTQAQTYWGADPNGCPGAAVTRTPRRETCNGNGSDTIGDSGNATTGLVTYAAGVTPQEWFRMWQHLANANLIEGLYSGTGAVWPAPPDADRFIAELGNNVPASGFHRGGWMLHYYLQTADQPHLWGDHYGHLMFFGAQMLRGTANPLLTREDALGIDLKLDDGKPSLGKIRSQRNVPNCVADNADPQFDAYNTGFSGPACAMIFIMGF